MFKAEFLKVEPILIMWNSIYLEQSLKDKLPNLDKLFTASIERTFNGFSLIQFKLYVI